MEVGQRVEAGGNRGTIGYIGPVDGQAGQWVGIDWDDENRGKHDGSVASKRYFYARSSRSASFVRVSNVEFGKKIDDEMRNRYSADSKMDSYELGMKVIHFVAMEKIHRKQRDIYKLRCVVLDGMHVAFPPSSGSPLFKFCTELNLYNNLISKWKDLLAILSFFPSLLYLNLRKNFMEPRLASVSDDTKPVEAPIFHLVLSDCRIDQLTAVKIFNFFPKLEELYVGCNKLCEFRIPESNCRLRLLDLEDNYIKRFSNISSLSNLGSLTSLNVSNCSLSEIEFGNSAGFPALTDLYLRNNELKDWGWINEIAKLPALIRLYIKGHRGLDEEFGSNTREAIIAKIPKLVELDRCVISHLERRSAEILFLDRYGVPPVAGEHQCAIERLKIIYGEPEIAQPESKFGISLLTLKFVYKDKSIVRSVPAAMSVQKLYGMASRLFRLNVRKVRLYAENITGKITFEFDNPLRSLSFFDLDDGDVIFIRDA